MYPETWHYSLQAPGGRAQLKRPLGDGARQPLLPRKDRWRSRVEAMERLAAGPGFGELRREIIELARLTPTDRVLDVGAGTGLLTLAAAPVARYVLALDVSPAMCAQLQRKIASSAISNVDVVLGDAAALPAAYESFDVVVSNYCLHHLRDADKHRAIAEMRRVLRPGGRLVIGDMMFNVGLGNKRDRALLVRFVTGMLRRGPAGLVRIIKNLVRLLTGRGEHPRDVDFWDEALEAGGFVDVSVRPLDHEGGVAAARRPAAGTQTLAGQPTRAGANPIYVTATPLA